MKNYDMKMELIEHRIGTIGQSVSHEQVLDIVSRTPQFEDHHSGTHDMTSNRSIIKCGDDLITWGLSAVVGKHPDNNVKGTFDYVEISISLLEYGYSRKEILECVKEFKSDFDLQVSKKLARISKSYKIPVGFFSLNNIIFTSDNILIYKFSLKGFDVEIDIEE